MRHMRYVALLFTVLSISLHNSIHTSHHNHSCNKIKACGGFFKKWIGVCLYTCCTHISTISGDCARRAAPVKLSMEERPADIASVTITHTTAYPTELRDSPLHTSTPPHPALKTSVATHYQGCGQCIQCKQAQTLSCSNKENTADINPFEGNS